MTKKEGKIKIAKNGPYLISGIPLDRQTVVRDDEGNSMEWKKTEDCSAGEEYALCRCGKSKNKPYCDGSHVETKFDGTETASRKKYLEQAKKISGDKLDMCDCEGLCSGARFCHNKQGSAWELTKNSGNPKSKKMAIQQCCNCPSGRLVAYDKKTGKAIEPKFKKSISLTEDPEMKVSGPIWVKGEVPIESSNGQEYEKRNRVTLCRCGKSQNKPFCDGSHIESNFKEKD